MRPLGVPSRCVFGIGAEVGQQRQPVLGGQPQLPAPPELVERRHREIQSGAPTCRTCARATAARVRPSVNCSPNPSRSASAANVV